MLKRSGSLALAIVALVALAAGPAYAQTAKCQSAKIKAVSKKAACVLGVRSKAVAKNLQPDPTKIAACEMKFSAAFSKAALNPCSTNGDAGTIESAVDAFVGDVVAEVVVNPPPSKCQAAKLKTAGKKAGCLLAVEAAGVAKGIAADTVKLGACKSKFSAAFAKADAGTDCGASKGDAAAIEDKVDAFDDDMACVLKAGPACNCGGSAPTFLSFTNGLGSGNCGSGLNDVGALAKSLGCNNLYTGGGGAAVPPATVPDYGNTRTKASCCRSKFVALEAATSSDTGSNRNCSDTGCFYGPPLPIISGASVCVINKVAKPAVGHAYCDAGSINLNLPLNSDVYLTLDVLPNRPGTQPCPVCLAGACVGDGSHDGMNCTMNSDCGAGTCATGNTCHGGPNNGMACTPGELLVTGPQWPTSHDCPPPGPALGTLPIPYLLTTGTAAKTALNESGAPMQARVFCGFCSSPSGPTFRNPPVACLSDSDCAAFTMGCPGPSDPCTACKQHTGGAFGTAGVRTITENGSPAGAISTGGPAAPATLASVFCIPPTFNFVIDGVGDLPGPGAVSLQGSAQLLP